MSRRGHSGRRAVAGAVGGGAPPTTHTMRAITVDCANNYGGTSFLGIRSIDLYLDDVLLEITAINRTFGQTSFFSSLLASRSFLSFYLKTGSIGEQWLSASAMVTNQRIWMRSDTDLIFNRIVVNNSHNTGTQTDNGAKDVVINITEDTGTPSSAYNVSMPGEVKIYDAQFLRHIDANEADPQELLLIP